MADRPHRSGVVALLGRPNAGKSTLLNRLLGQKLAIVTSKPQTTRSRILGILTRDDAQLLLLDTPGFHESPKALNRLLNEVVDEVADDCDVAVILVEARRGWDEGHAALLERLKARKAAVVVVATQCDLGPPSERVPADFQISAKTGDGIDAFVEALVGHLPEGPAYYDAESVTDRSMRFLAAELIREAVFEALEQELPYETAVEIEAFDESDPSLTRISATLLVEKKSQKGMVVGKGGQMIRQIGTAARHALAEMLETRVHLELWVKVEPRWTKRPNRLKSLGYH
ncbi:MAG: GTPase Era [Deltaproteobacteria bacterium]|nr:GTPase Era [Deltaproteobacteria bacterium]MBW2396073.1 GTPase Era [Deltaproteobacteria bacterium]